MRVLFVQDYGINESLALCELSALLRHHGHRTELLLEAEEPDLDARVEAFDPDVVLIPVGIMAHHWATDVTRRLRPRVRGPIVIGGLTPTFFPDLLSYTDADALIVGEAEYAMLDLVEAVRDGRPYDDIPNLVVRRPDGTLKRNPPRPLIPDLSALPLPDRELYYRYPFMRDFPWKKFTSSRGCVHSCSYCPNRLLRKLYKGRGTFLRQKTVERVMAEIEDVRGRSRLERVHFSDDLFATRVEWVEEFCEQYPRRVGLPFSLNLSVEYVEPRTVRALAGAGCRMIAVGVEVADEARRNRLLNKDLDNDQVREAAALIRDHGIDFCTFNMLGNPGEDFDGAWETLDFNVEIGTDFGRCTLSVPIPGTQFYDRAKAEGMLVEQVETAVYDLPDLRDLRYRAVFRSDDRDRITNLFYLFPFAVNFPWTRPLVRRLCELPPNPVMRLMELYGVYQEKRINQVGWLDGLRFFKHVGPPHRRSTVIVFLI